MNALVNVPRIDDHILTKSGDCCGNDRAGVIRMPDPAQLLNRRRFESHHADF